MTADEKTLLNLLGYVFLRSGRPDKAAVVLTALNVLAPGEPRALRALAMAHLKSDKPQKALDTLDRLAMAGGVDAAFHLLRAQALTKLARLDEATAAMKSYVHLRQAAVITPTGT